MSGKIIWEKLPGVPDLSENQVHIWRVSLAQSAESLPGCSRDLSSEELARAARFHFERDRRRHIVSHSWLRRLLGAYLGVSPAAIQFEIAEHGKPQLGGNQAGSKLNFNLAHSGEIALLGFCRGVELGVDIEQVRPIPDMLQVAARFFSQHEQAQLAQVPPDRLARAFFKCWTCKEAFIKNLGDGLYYPLDQFDVNLHPQQSAHLLRVSSDPHEASSWQLVSFPVAEDYLGALAVRDTTLQVRYLERL
jgi:4'-phosphopantetheinyl transferase